MAPLRECVDDPADKRGLGPDDGQLDLSGLKTIARVPHAPALGTGSRPAARRVEVSRRLETRSQRQRFLLGRVSRVGVHRREDFGQ